MKIYIIKIESGSRALAYARQLCDTEHLILMDTLQAILRAGFITGFNVKEAPTAGFIDRINVKEEPNNESV